MLKDITDDIIYYYINTFIARAVNKIIVKILIRRRSILSKEIISKIKEAEAQAQKIRSDAQDEAKNRIRVAEANGKKLCEDTENRIRKQNKEKLDVAKSRADDVLDKARESSEAEAEAMREAAEFNMREAVRAIIAGVNEQCQ